MSNSVGTIVQTRWSGGVRIVAAVAFAILSTTSSTPLRAQAANDATPPGWQTGTEANTSVIPRAPEELPDSGENSDIKVLKCVAFLTSEGQRIERGLVWRLFEIDANTGQPELQRTLSEAGPVLRLRTGSYIINVTFGRAHLTRKFDITDTTPRRVERFVLNAGGLRVKTVMSRTSASGQAAKYDIYSDRDQLNNRELVLSNVKPDLIVRLNAGIYHIVSTYGDANAQVESDVTVEAGKLTEATVTHTAAMVTFKLVERQGGEAVPDTQWSVTTPKGQLVKQSVGALPTHILAPGTYTVVGQIDGQSYQKDFSVNDGELIEVEVVRQ